MLCMLEILLIQILLMLFRKDNKVNNEKDLEGSEEETVQLLKPSVREVRDLVPPRPPINNQVPPIVASPRNLRKL